METILAHELAHSAYSRKRKKQGKRFFLLDSEIISSMIELEYMADSHPKHYAEYLQNAGKHSFLTIRTQFGNRMALEIHKHFPKTIRQKLIRELLDRNFVRKENALRWLQQKLVQYNVSDQKLEHEIQNYLEGRKIKDRPLA